MRYLFYVLLLVLIPELVSAHETRTYRIDGIPYEIVVGSVGEPVVVDDKTAVSVEIVRDGEYLEGAEAYLQVELVSEGVNRMQPLVPAYGNVGTYRSKYIATAAVPLTYRLVGMLEGVPVDLSFPCSPIGHQHTAIDEKAIEIVPGVIQTSKEGMFSCPESKDGLGFPFESQSIHVLASKEIDDAVSVGSPLASDYFILQAVGVGTSMLTLYLLWYTHRKKTE